MGLLLLRRLAAIAVTLLVVSVLVFGLLRLVPGDPAGLILGDTADPAQLARVRTEMGLDRPLPLQYLAWLSHVARGDLGRSFMTDEPVAPALVRHFLVTLQIVIPAFVLSALIAIPAGVAAAARRNTPFDLALVGLATLCVSTPSFWGGLLLALLFGAQLGWLPALGFVPLSESPGEWLRHAILPVTALCFVETGVLLRLVRAHAIEVLGQDYIAYARARGVSNAGVMWRHVLKNALAPTLPMLGLILSSLLSGAAVIETVFGIPGLGRLLVDAIYARDYPVIQGVLLFVVAVYALVNLAVDLMHPLLDPRVRPS